ncbi:MAG: SMP-30/gluconolactonase/LRE family protein [Pseudomonadota bacterium]
MSKTYKTNWLQAAALASFLSVSACSVLGTDVETGRISSADTSQCAQIRGMPGAEDIEADFATGFVYVSSDDRRARQNNIRKNGAIYKLWVNGSAARVPEKMSGTENISRFHPHGISLFKDGDRTLLFVISHDSPEDPSANHKVHIFEVQGNHLRLVETIMDEGLRSPNDIAAVGPRQFYVTNDRKSLSGAGQSAEVLLGLAKSNVTYFDGRTTRIAADNIAFANGVRLSADGSKLFVTASRSGELIVYSRNPLTGKLMTKKRVPLGKIPDNISLAKNGDLWIAEQPSASAFLAHSKNPEKHSPFRIFTVNTVSYDRKIVFESSGKAFSAASVAVPINDRILIGSVFEDGILECIR